MNHSTYAQNRQQALILGSAMFGSIVAAVLVSTFIIMSLMRGEMANALATTPATSVVPASATACVSPADTATGGEGSGAWTEGAHATGGYGSEGAAYTTAWKPVSPASKALPSSTINNSYNSSNNTSNVSNNNATTTTTSNITGSYNGAGNGNTDNSIKTVNTNINSGNTLTDNSVNTDNSQINSNNDVDVLSNNDILSDNELLSDNVVIPVVPIVAVP